jgi:hypothetical protein
MMSQQVARSMSRPATCCLTPHAPHVSLNVYLRRLAGNGRPSRRGYRPSEPFKVRQQGFGNETRSRRIHVAVAL